MGVRFLFLALLLVGRFGVRQIQRLIGGFLPDYAASHS